MIKTNSITIYTHEIFHMLHIIKIFTKATPINIIC